MADLIGMVRKQVAAENRDRRMSAQGGIEQVRDSAAATVSDEEQARLDAQAKQLQFDRLMRTSAAPPILIDRLDELKRVPGWVKALKTTWRHLDRWDSGAIVALIGDYRTGKSQIAVWAIRQFADRGWESRYVRAGALFRRIDDARNSGDAQDSIIRDMARPELLVIDELDKPQESIARGALLAELLDIRHTTRKHTLLIGNYSREGFDAGVDKSIRWRIVQHGDIIVMEGWNFATGEGT